MKTNRLILALCLVGAVSGCANMSSSEQRTLSGAGIGAAAGALIGGLAVGRPQAGAAWGAALGGAGGWLYDRHEKAQK